MPPTTSHILLFTIGPVQSFIAQARKTQDLFVGSQLLSGVITGAGRVLTEAFGVDNIDFIFPSAASLHRTDDSKTNRILAVVKHVPTAEIGEKLQRVEDEVRAEFHATARERFDTLLKKEPTEAAADEYRRTKRRFENQISELLELYYVAVPLAENPNDDTAYRQAFIQAERQLGSIKNLRAFSQTEAIAGRKCIISGTRNALFYHAKRRDRYMTDGILVSPRSSGSFLLSRGEAIDAVGLLKRVYDEDRVVPFPSTADLTLLRVREQHPQPFADFAKQMERKLGVKLQYNGQLFYEDNLAGSYLKKQYGMKTFQRWETDQDDLRAAHARLLKALAPDRLHKYYGLLLFDGDRMGKWLSGEQFSDRVPLREFHTHLSELLSNYAQYARAYVDDPQYVRGKTVYAGGDDFLAFVTLETLFATMTHLYRKFRELVSDPVREFTGATQPLTISMGVSVVHYKHPLENALAQTRRMEKRAKDTGRNRFAISVVRNSGNISESSYAWGEEPELLPEQFDRVLHLLTQPAVAGNDQAAFSSRFVNTLRTELERFDADDVRFGHFDRVVEAEIRRLVLRAQHARTPQAAVDQLVHQLTELFHRFDGLSREQERLDHFVSALIILNFLQRNTL